MRFLADMGVSLATVRALRAQGHEAVHLREIGLARLEDAAALEKARGEDRILLTFDLDYGDLLAASGQRLPSVIIFRLRDQTPAVVTPRLLEVLSQQAAPLSAGVIITVEDNRYRVRALPIAHP
jgi:predicted nuclease of predicted toxin-antitoxin system